MSEQEQELTPQISISQETLQRACGYDLEEEMLASTQFQKLRYSEWLQSDPHEQRLLELAIEYHRRCDAYDGTVCTGRYKGEIVPATAEERRASEHCAIQTRKELIARSGITEQEFHKAMKLYSSRENRTVGK